MGMEYDITKYRVKVSDEPGYDYYDTEYYSLKSILSDKLRVKLQDFLKNTKTGIKHGHEYRLYPFGKISDYSTSSQILMELKLWFAPSNDEDDVYGDIDVITIQAVPYT